MEEAFSSNINLLLYTTFSKASSIEGEKSNEVDSLPV